MTMPKKLVRNPSASPTQLTVRGTMELAFPRGYVDHPYYEAKLEALGAGRLHAGKLQKGFSNPPASAVDLFAVIGLLLVRSGAYHHVVSDDPTSRSPRTICVTAADRARWIEAGRAWRGDTSDELPPPPQELLDAWKVVLDHGERPIFRSGDNWTTMEPWWAAAVALYAIADEAASDLGFDSDRPKSAQSRYVEHPLRYSQKAKSGLAKKPYSFSKADRDHVCILPKSRTPGVGCTIRSLSHHLALLPSRSLARAHWTFSSHLDQTRASPDRPFNVAVVPLPFVIEASAFKGRPVDGGWGWFGVEPHWCPASTDALVPPEGFERFVDFVMGILRQAEADAGAVDALILPEVALSSQVFRLLVDRLTEADGPELLISGLFDRYDARTGTIREGNFTGMARFVRPPKDDAPNFANIAIREKHHRWRIDDAQIETYDLGTALDVNRKWWEGIDILSRSLDVFVLRGNATVTTLICEDLARNDPCQELVRGIGPNFVVALLMDGPQRRDRWPARYGTVLAEDPGSSVLTLTSYGLIARSNATGRFAPACQIGLFRDDTGRATEIELPAGAQAVCMTLQPSALVEHTMDGRSDNGDAQSWRLDSVTPIILSNADADIMVGNWPAGKP